MLIAILSFLTFSFSSFAHTLSQENLAKEETELHSLRESFEYAEASLPPCDGLDYESSAAMKYVPPKSCPLATNFYESISKLDIRVRQNCRDLSHWLEDEIKRPKTASFSCDLVKRKFRIFKFELFPEALDLEIEKALTALGAMDSENGQLAKGEGARFECAFPVTVGLQFRKKILSLANRHYGHADMATDDICTEYNQADAKDYLLYLRGGEAALNLEFHPDETPRD